MLRKPLSGLFVLSLVGCSSGAGSPTYGSVADSGPPGSSSDGSVSASEGGVDGAKPPPTEAGVNPEGGITPGSDGNLLPSGVTATWSKRTCSVTIKYTGTGTKVTVAGDFTDWGTSPLPMSGSAGNFTLTVSPGAKLQGGELHGYKFVVDGNWVMDDAAPWRKFDQDCINSAFRMPDCDAAPEIQADALKVTLAGGAGTATVRVRFASATDGAAALKFTALLDGSALPAGAAKLDAAAGAFDLSMSGLAKGKHSLKLTAGDKSGRSALPVDLPFWVEDRDFDPRDGVLYMVMTDRFANGDKTSDKPVGAPLDYPADWHGGDLVGARKVLESGYFEELGVRTIWLSPVNTQVDGAWPGKPGDSHQYSGYHGYWPIKARQVDPRIGGDAALKAFVAEAHKRGIRVLIDLINNQVHEQHEYVAAHKDWFRYASTTCVCGNDAVGCGWSQRPFDCLFDPFLPDINWRVADAEKQFIDDAVSWLADFDLDGFRVDAVKHVEPNSIFDLRATLAQRFEQGGQRVFMVGETAVGEGDKYNFFCQQFNDGYQWIDAYTGQNALDGQFDFPTHHQLREGLLNGSMGFDAVEGVVRKLETKYRPGGMHVRFLGSQDSNRVSSVASGDPGNNCKWSDQCGSNSLPPAVYSDAGVYTKLKRAFTVLYTLPGIPFLYAGDELAQPGGQDPDNRRNMLWIDALADQYMSPTPGAATLSDAQKGMRDWLRAIGKARASSSAITRGKRIPVLAESDLYVVEYRGTGPKDVALVVVNRGAAVSARAVGTLTDHGSATAFSAAAGTGQATLAGDALSVTVGAGESAIFLAQ